MYLKAAFLVFLNLSFLSCVTNGNSRNCKATHYKVGPQDLEIKLSRYGGQSSQKSIIIVPPTGRTNYIDRSYAEEFCRAGYDAYIMDSWTGDMETTMEFEIHQRFYSQAQKAIQLVIEQIKSPYIGLIGTSVGGLHAAIAANYQDKIQSVFAITAGISIAQVVVNSDQEAMVQLKKDRQIKYGIKSDQQMIEAIDKVFTYEPQQLSEKFKNKDLGLSIGLKDHTVPTETQINLKNYWKPKKVLTFSNDHFWTIVKTWLFESDEVLSFFEDSYQSFISKKS